MALNEQMYEELGEISAEIVDDYDHWREPFRQTGGITTPITNKMDSKRDKALFLTLVTALNRQRDAEQLYKKFEQLYYEEPWIFEPTSLVEDRRFAELVELFEERGTRFGRKDAEYWYEISLTLYEEYDSDPMNLFEACKYNMQRLEEVVRTQTGETRFFKHGKRFPGLRGNKIRPMWLRLVSSQVKPMTQMEGSDISVDTHITKITSKLLGEGYSTEESDKEEVRQFWRRVCESSSVNPVDVDGPLWFIHRDWEDWGRKYLVEKLTDRGLELGQLGTAHSEPSLPAGNTPDSLHDIIVDLEDRAETLRGEAQQLDARADDLRDLREDTG